MKLYRGINKEIKNGVYKNKNIETPRKPRDTNIETHKIIDEWFEKKFKIKARSTTIFCSTDKEQASNYGTVYEFKIPENEEYEIIFSEEVDDILMISVETNETKEKIEEWLENKNYKLIKCKNDIPEDFKGELMISIKKYELTKCEI